ncbi:MAG TPA: hypothetical protein VN370_14160 [Desulfitobacteriaceae bacterium]|nr:hypothetical protein [Desulfitobacteriaceae bacterium]
MKGKLGFFDADSRELGDSGSLIFRPRVRHIGDKLNRLYEIVAQGQAVLAFNTCCSGNMLMPDSREDILFIPMELNDTGWKGKVKDYRIFYLEKRKSFDPTADVLCNIFDLFSDNKNGALLIKELDINEWVVFGNGLDFCVDNAVKSLLRMGCKVTFLEDVMISSAAGYGNSGTEESRESTYRNWTGMGAVKRTLEQFLMEHEFYV